MQNSREFYFSKSEIRRRKIAYISFVISWVIGLTIASYIFALQSLLFLTVLIVIIMTIVGIISFRSNASLIKSSIELTNNTLKRIYPGTHEEYRLDEIKKVNTKWTSTGKIREICIHFDGPKKIFINGLNEFNQFEKILKANLKNSVLITATHEPIDFDHPLFYPVLGQLMCILCFVLIRLFIDLNTEVLKMIGIGFSILVSCIGVLLIYTKPVSKHYGKDTSVMDWILGLLMICPSIVLLLFALILI